MCDGDDCCRTFSKVLLIIVNLFFLLLGLLMLAFGIAMVVAPGNVAQSVMNVGVDLGILGTSDYLIKGAGIFMIVLGGIIALLGSFGFFGACCENKVLLILYLIIVIIILLAEVALIIFAAVAPTTLRNIVVGGLNNTLPSNFSDVHFNQNGTMVPITKNGDNDAPAAWAITQLTIRCCGAESKTDYDRYKQKNVIEYPVSCCKLKPDAKFPNINKNSFVDPNACNSSATAVYNDNGCYPAVDSMIKQASKIAIGIAAAIVGAELIIIILGFILCCSLHNSKSLTV